MYNIASILAEVAMKKPSKTYTAMLILSLMALVLSAAIAVPLLWRGFYYLHINGLDLPGRTGFTVAEIRGAFDEMMDFCVFKQPFGTGVMKWSQDGYLHFVDCEVLFRMDFTVFAVSLAAVMLLWHMRDTYKAVTICGKGPMFWAGSVLAGAFVVIAGFAALDFDRAFVIFHSLFFPGKTNWIFDYRTDQIINVLPQVVFRNYGILIVGLLFAGCIGLILADKKRK